jgi:mycothiol synthase
MNPQLQMRHLLCPVPAKPTCKEGFVLRIATPDDADALAEILTLGFDSWDRDRVFRELLDDPNVPETYVVCQGERVVGTASYQLKPDQDPSAGWVHYVGVHPDTQGHRLGELLTHRVLQECRTQNRTCALLTTDDFRLPAIKTYLKLGFEPVCWHESHRARWVDIRKALNQS